MPKDFKRSDRIAILIQEELAEMIRDEVKDPRLPKFITISQISVSPDLKQAKVYLTVLGEKEAGERAVSILNHAAPFLRTLLAKSMRLRATPQLHFIYDAFLEEALHLSHLIDKL